LGDQLAIIRPDDNILQSALDVNQERMKQTFEAGQIKGKAFLDSLNKI